MLRAAPEQPANMRLTGLRGVGKTVLLQEFDDLATKREWVTAFLELGPSHNTDDGILSALVNLSEQARARISRLEAIKSSIGRMVRGAGTLSVTWNDVTLAIDPATMGQGARNVTKTLYDLCVLAVDKGMRGVILLLDEAQVLRDEKGRHGDHPLSILISSIVALQKQTIPIGLVLCGLPTLTSNLLNARSYTERMFRAEEIGSLEREEARQALTQPLKDGTISIAEVVVEKVVDEVEGYPYFVQLWGAELWESAYSVGATEITEAIFDATTAEVYRRLDLEFYEPRLLTLRPAEQEVLLATAGVKTYPPLHAAEIKKNSDKSSGNINVLLGRMVDAGVIYRLRMGQYDYTAPRFRDYLNRRLRKMNAHP